MENINGFTYESVYIDSEKNRWFFAMDLNAIFMITPSNIIRFVTTINEYSFMEKKLYGAVDGNDKQLVFAPYDADRVLIYLIKEKRYELIPLPDEVIRYTTKAMFFSCKVVSDTAYMFGLMCPVVIALSLENYYIQTINIEHLINWKKGAFRNQISQIGQYLYTPCLSENSLLRMNTKTLDCISLKVGSEEMGFSGIKNDGNDFWIVSLNKNIIYCWNENEGVKDKIEIPTNIISGDYRFLDSELYDGKLYGFTANDNPIVIYDIKTRLINRLDFPAVGSSIASVRCHYIHEGKLICVRDSDGKHFLLKNNEAVEYDTHSDLSEVREIISKTKAVNINNIIEEKEFFTLDMFLNYVSTSQI